MTLAHFRTRFNLLLAIALNQHVAEFQGIIDDPSVSSFMAHAATITLAGGKRIRPYLVDLMYRSAGGTETESITSATIGIELFHMFCLIHDDIIDLGDLRHHTPTVHTFAAQQLQLQKRFGDAHHYGTSQAILVGDQFMAWALESMVTLPMASLDTQTEIKKLFFSMVQEVIAGQMLDVDLTSRQTTDTDTIHRKDLLKTAHYSFVKPMLIGRALATSNQSFDSFMTTFGTNLGLAFQLQDDLVDWSNSDAQSKTHLADITSRQHTLIRQYIVRSGPKYAATLERLESQTKPDPQALHDLGNQSGALAFGQTEVKRLLTLAAQALADVHFPTEITKEWMAIIDMIRSLQNG